MRAWLTLFHRQRSHPERNCPTILVCPQTFSHCRRSLIHFVPRISAGEVRGDSEMTVTFERERVITRGKATGRAAGCGASVGTECRERRSKPRR